MRPITRRVLLMVVVTVGLIAAATSVMSQQAPPGNPPADRGAQREGNRQARGPSIEGAMKTVDRASKRLAKQIEDPAKKDENLKLINEMERGCVTAKGQPLPDDVLSRAADDAAKATMKETFHRDLVNALQTMLDIERDVMDGHNDAAKSKLDQLTKLREESHKALGVKDDEDEEH